MTKEQIRKELSLYLPAGMKDFELENLCKAIQSLLLRQSEKIADYLEGKKKEEIETFCEEQLKDSGYNSALTSSAQAIREGRYLEDNK